MEHLRHAHDGRRSEMVCEDCGEATDWTSDGKRIVGNDTRGRVWLVDLASRRKTELVVTLGDWFYDPQLSPDNRWITFATQFVAPFRGEATIPKSAWTAVPELTGCIWSPDGTFLYCFSGRDGFGCIWAQRLDPATKRPQGPVRGLSLSRLAALAVERRRPSAESYTSPRAAWCFTSPRSPATSGWRSSKGGSQSALPAVRPAGPG